MIYYINLVTMCNEPRLLRENMTVAELLLYKSFTVFLSENYTFSPFLDNLSKEKLFLYLC